MVTAILATMALILTYISVKTSYYILRFFAGTLWWALGVWLIKTPLVAGGDPLNDMMLTICFFCGLAMMFMMGWRTSDKGEGSFTYRLPTFLGGRTEDEEAEEARRTARTYRGRQEAYRDRLNNTIRGRRR